MNEGTKGPMSGSVKGRTDGRSPDDEFIAGQGPLAAALRELPAFEPPARMAGEFQRMLAGMPAGAPAFEPPARLEAAVLGEISRQQAAQATRRDTVLGEVARGADPAAALDAKVSPATQAWLRERSLAGEGAPTATTDRGGAGARGRDTSAGHDRDVSRKGKRPGWPAGWWRYAGGGLAAVLALGVGLRVTLAPTPQQAPARVTTESTSEEAQGNAATFADSGGAMSQAPQAMERQGFAEPARKQQAREAETRRDTLASRERQDRERAMQERRSSAAAAPPPPAAARSAAPRPAPAPSAAPTLGETPALATRQESEPGAEYAGPSWRLSDDPTIRLAGLPAGSRWILLCHPSEHGAAEAWLQRGLDALTANGAGARMSDSLPAAVRIEAHEDVVAGELRMVPDE